MPVVLFVIVFGLRRTRVDLAIPIASLAIAAGFAAAQKPGTTVHFEDAHVVKQGGHMYPEQWAAIRWFWPGGWILLEGNSVSFLAREGTYVLHGKSDTGGTIVLDGRTYQLPATSDLQEFEVQIRASGRTTLRCVSGVVFVDRMVRE